VGWRLSRTAGALAATLMIARLDRLFLPSPEHPSAWVIPAVSLVVGAVAWRLLDRAQARRRSAGVLLAVGAAWFFTQVAAPETLIGGAIPSGDTPGALLAATQEAIRRLRWGVPPVEPSAGVAAFLAVLMWGVGAFWARGLSKRSAAAMTIPSLALYLQFAVFDRARAGPWWMAAFAVVLALTVAALGLERRAAAGRARDREGRPLPRRSAWLAMTTAALIGLVAVLAAVGASKAKLTPEFGHAPWRSWGGGYGPGGGSVAFDRLVGLRQQLVDLPDTVVFQAVVDGGDFDEAGRVYWRMESLDEFDGAFWRRSDMSAYMYEPGRDVGDPDHRYRGTEARLFAQVRIEALSQQVAPTPGVAAEILPIDADGAIRPAAFATGDDAAIIYLPGLRRGDSYQVATDYPLHAEDLGGLATGPDGRLSPIFQAAVDAGETALAPTASAGAAEAPDDLSFFTRLPSDLPQRLAAIARRQTRGASTDFERAYMLESWLKSSEFRYSTEVSTGHGALDLADWLADPESLNHRTGYCEQFAAAMAVLGRALDIPSRVVWGFAPGETVADRGGAAVVEVRGTNAHAWVEMWMEGYGWVKFDPTPRGDIALAPVSDFDPTGFTPESELSREAPVGDPSGLLEDEAAALPPGDGADTAPPWRLPAALALASLLPVIPTTKAVRRRRRLRAARAGDIAAAWDEIVDRLTDMGRMPPPSLTPMEAARAANPALAPLAAGYSAAVYGERRGGDAEPALLEAEATLRETCSRAVRAKAALRPTSLLRRR